MKGKMPPELLAKMKGKAGAKKGAKPNPFAKKSK